MTNEKAVADRVPVAEDVGAAVLYVVVEAEAEEVEMVKEAEEVEDPVVGDEGVE